MKYRVCKNESILPILNAVQKIVTLIQTIVPILLLIGATISLVKLITNPEEQKGIKPIVNKFLAAAIVFFIPLIVNITLQIVGDNTDFSTCWKQAKISYKEPIKYYEIDEEEKKKILANADDYEPGEIVSENACMSKDKSNKVLFVGNSKTYVHDIPNKVKQMATNQGYTISVKSVTRGGYTLSELADEFSSKITSGSYDCVILQEQTDVYMWNPGTYANGAKKVISLAKSTSPNAKFYIRALWATSSADQGTRQNSYQVTENIAQQNQAIAIHDGKAFDNSRAIYGDINLFGDDIHQSEAGAYLSAAMIYKSIAGRSPENITYTANLSKETANRLLNVAIGTE